MLTNVINDMHLVLTNSYKKLRTAISNDNIDLITSICTKQPRILTAPLDREGNSPLGFAIKCRSVAAVQTLLKCGADVDAGNITENVCPLNMIIRQGTSENEIKQSKELMDILMEYNCQIDYTRMYSQTNREGIPYYVEITSLMDAISMEQIAIVEYLILKGANVNFMCQFSAIINLVIHHGADVAHKSSDGNSALHWLASCEKEDVNFKEVVNCLVNAGTNINEVNEEGQTALMLAISKSLCKLVDELISRKADLTIKDRYDFNAQEYAYHMNCSHCAIAVEEGGRNSSNL